MNRAIFNRLFIFNYLGSFLVVLGVVLLLPLLPYLYYGEHDPGGLMWLAYAGPAMLSAAVGFVMQKRVPSRVPEVREAMIITAMAWIIASLICALPFVFVLGASFVDAAFEAASGLTTTGITVFSGLDAMPRSILFWRSFIQWIGGLGILTFFLMVTFRGGSASATLFGAEGHKIASSRPVPGIFNTLKILWSIYAFFTVSSLVLLRLEGMSLFDAMCHSMTAISTGGFSTHDASVGFFSRGPHGILIEYTIIFFMLMGGINFLIHFNVLKGRWRTIYQDFEMSWFWAILTIATVVVAASHLRHHHVLAAAWVKGPGAVAAAVHEVLRTSLFQVTSLITSTGYATKDIGSAYFPPLARQVFLLLMFVGGCVGSTAGGIKVLRVGILYQTLKTEIIHTISPPRTVAPVTIRGKIIGTRELQRVGALFFAWLALLVVGAAITDLFSDLNGWQGLSGMLSALGNMGPFYFSVAKMASLHPVIKITYFFAMLAGRLEILPLLVLFYPPSWR